VSSSVFVRVLRRRYRERADLSRNENYRVAIFVAVKGPAALLLLRLLRQDFLDQLRTGSAQDIQGVSLGMPVQRDNIAYGLHDWRRQCWDRLDAACLPLGGEGARAAEVVQLAIRLASGLNPALGHTQYKIYELYQLLARVSASISSSKVPHPCLSDPALAPVTPCS
jgi:hypothetical protein